MDNKALLEPEKELEFEARCDKEYVVGAIIDNAVYGQQANNNQMSRLYYLVLWKGYLEEENTWKLSLAIIHLRKLISTFYKEYPKKPTATSLPLDSVLPMVRTMILNKPKQKRGRSSKRANKRSKNSSIRNVRNTRAVYFVASDVDVVLKPLIQSFQTPCPYPQSINQHPVFL